MKHIGLTEDEEIASFGNLKEHATITRENSKRNGIATKKCTQYITTKTVKRIGTLSKAKETVYKDIHIHVLIKTVEGQDVEYSQ